MENISTEEKHIITSSAKKAKINHYKKPPQMLVAYTLFKNLFYLESCNLSTVWWNLFISAPLSTAGETQKLEWAEVPLVHTNGG